MEKKLVLGIAAAMMLLPAAFAQTAPPAPPVNSTAPAHKTRIVQRKANQQKRIAQGVQSGQLTPRETAKLENKEAKLNKQVAQDREANGGKLTSQEKKQVHRQQNKMSKQIYKAKHNTAVESK